MAIKDYLQLGFDQFLETENSPISGFRNLQFFQNIEVDAMGRPVMGSLDNSLISLTEKKLSEKIDPKNIKGGELGKNVNVTGRAKFYNITTAGKTIVIDTTGNIQDAIDEVNNFGGGTVILRNGTHIPTSALTMYSNIVLEGETPSGVILDFDSTVGVKIQVTGTNVYNTGTITSISGGTNVTGSGTSWSANVTTDHQFFIAQRWYKIASITDDTHLVLAEGYAGGATFPGASYRATKVVKDIRFKNLTIQDPNLIGLDIDDCRNVSLENVTITGSGGDGINFTNLSEIKIDNILVTSCTENGIVFNTCGFMDIESMSTPDNAVDGVTLTSCRLSTIVGSSSDSNSDGYYITSCSSLLLIVGASSNASQGIELVSGNTNIFILASIVENNTSDGIKLTATSDQCIISSCALNDNGGYGVNVAASTCDDNIITGSVFSGNTSGAINDSGTGTIKKSNSPSTIDDFGSLLYRASTDVTLNNSTSTAEETLFSVSIPANILGTNGGLSGIIFIELRDDLDAGTNTATIRFKYGATTVASTTYIATGLSDTTFRGAIKLSLFATGATNTQAGTLEGDVSTVGLVVYNSAAGTDGHWKNLATGTAAEDSTGALNLTVTVQWSGTSPADYQYVKMFAGSFINKIIS